ncbi:MAG: HU family DNA-binding protein [Desulfobacteraceae bacterium]|jgi:integration host factor subunit alpha
MAFFSGWHDAFQDREPGGFCAIILSCFPSDLMTVNKADHIQSVSRTGMSHCRSTRVVNSLVEIMKQTLERGEEIAIRGFGKFRVCHASGLHAKTGANGTFLPPGAKRVVIFRCSPSLGHKINGKVRKDASPRSTPAQWARSLKKTAKS